MKDVGDKKCWWQLKNASDGFDHFGLQHPIVANFKSPTSLLPILTAAVMLVMTLCF